MDDKINKFMTSYLGPSWRTTLIGFAAAVFNLAANGVSFKTAVASALMQTFGYLAKDTSVHSTIEQVHTATITADPWLAQ